MISKMINQTLLTKEDRKSFIPFINERDHMGLIIKNRPKGKQYLKSIQVFENLKKTTKEHSFDKKFQKMKSKLQRYKHTLEPVEHDYDQQVKKCFKSLQKVGQSKKFNHLINKKQNVFFVDISYELNQNINTLKKQIDRKNNKKPSTMNSFTRLSTIQSNDPRANNGKLQSSSFFNSTFRGDRKVACPEIRKTGQIEENQKQKSNKISRDLFKMISLESQKMVDFTNFGLKYKHYVETKNQDPWKKWYIESVLQIFPGQKIKIKKLQKSIY